MILLVDNYDSFTYNLFQMMGTYDSDIQIIRNDQLTLQDIVEMKPSCIIFSPGPGRPSNAGIMEDIIRKFYKEIPMLGICLGYQAIGEVFGAVVTEAKEKMHGETSRILQTIPSLLFEGLDDSFIVGRYHSLIIENPDNDLEIAAVSESGEIMAIQHKDYPVYGVQFHPESILTPQGSRIIENFIQRRTRTC